jgi:tetratricopeptide (TPR) repeat protein
MVKPPFGEFDATEPVKAGALSVAGTHRSSGLRVRIHFPPLEGDELLDSALIRLRFDHPKVPKVLDFGSTTGRADELPGQSSYLVSQELIPLDDDAMSKSWPALRDLLVQTLECLSEGHAHHSFHGALSQRWVYRLPGDGRVQLCIEGWYLDGSGKVPAKLRPLLIAPEAANLGQISPALLVQMDLYCLGYMAWNAICGSPPRPPLSNVALSKFEPMFAVPSGFVKWMQQLLECSPERRPRSAADAVAHLLEVDRLRRTVVPQMVSIDVPASRPRQPSTGLSWGEMQASLPLLTKRSLPMRGRDELQDQLWAEFIRVTVHRRSRLVVLRGDAGVGKTRLADWLFHSLRRGGFAAGLQVLHAQVENPGSGLVAAFRRYVQVDGLDPRQVLARCSEWLRNAGDDQQVIAKLLAALIGGTGGMNPEQRQQAKLSIIDRISEQHPLMLWFEDLQWGAQSLEFITQLLEDSGIENLLIVATVRDEALLHRPHEAALLDRLLKLPTARTFDVAPLGEVAMSKLTEEQLYMTPKSALALSRRSQGNPLLAIQWVRQALTKKMAEVTKAGIELSPKAMDRLPDDTLRLCMVGIHSALRSVPKSQRVAALRSLTAAAVLGSPTRLEEWLSACEHLQLNDPQNLLRRAKEAQILRQDIGQLSFCHGLFSDALLFEASGKEDLTKVQAACGKALLHAFNGGRREIAERLFGVLKDSDRLDEALPALLVAIDNATTALNFELAEQLLVEATEICEQTDIGPQAPLRLRLLNFQAELLSKQDHLNEALQLAETVARDATAADWPELAARAARNAANIKFRQGKLAEALSEFGILILTNELLKSPRHQAAAMIGAAKVHERMGQLPTASKLLESSLGLLSGTTAGDMSTRASALRHLAAIGQVQGRLEPAGRFLAEAVRLENALGNQPSLLTTMSQMGELCARLGRNTKAKQLFRESATGLAALGSTMAIHPLMRLGYLATTEKDLAGAKKFAAEVEPLVKQSNSPRYEIMLLVLKAWISSETRDWTAWDELSTAVEDGFVATPVFDHVLAHCLADIGLTAARRGQAWRVSAVFDLSLRILEQLGELDESHSLRASFLKIDKSQPFSVNKRLTRET